MRLAGGFRLGAIGGVDITVDWSLVIIFFLITFSLATGVFAAWHADWGPGIRWITALVAALLFFASVLLHELSHAFVGRANGVSIRRITLFMFGGMAHMESEPASWRAELSMAIVGPFTSLLLGVVFLWLAGLVTGPLQVDPANPRAALGKLGPAGSLLIWLGPVNIVLGLFNLVPAFPLDGGRVLRALMWAATGNLRLATRRASQAGQGFAWLLMASGLALILGLRLPFFGSGVINGLWLTFIGWFLNNAAVMSYRQLVIRESLEDVPVRKLMQTHFLRISPQMRLGTLVNEHIMPSGQRAFPVEEKGRLLGMVSLRDLQKCERDAWQRMTVNDIMTPATELTTVAPDQDAVEALAIIGRRDLNQLAVVQNGVLVGLLRREDILKWLSLHAAPGLDRADDRPRLNGRKG
jgi:Zn-dependent protease/CBS domain-containing protein